MIGPLFSTKSIWMARFVWIPMWEAPFFWHPGIRTYFSLRDFSRLLFLLVLHEFDICVITSKKWVQKIKGQYMNRSTFWMIKYMNGSVFSKARYMNGVGFEIQARTPVPKLPLSYPTPRPPTPPPPPARPSHPEYPFYKNNWILNTDISEWTKAIKIAPLITRLCHAIAVCLFTFIIERRKLFW